MSESYKLKVNKVMSGFGNKVFFSKCCSSYFKRDFISLHCLVTSPAVCKVTCQGKSAVLFVILLFISNELSIKIYGW